MPSSEFEQALINYKNEHQSVGCIVTHLFGVPMLALSFPMMLINFRRGLTLFAAGWALQFIGHFCFEQNKPVLFTKSRNYLVPLAALFMVGQYWRDLLLGSFLIEDNNGHAKLLSRRKRARRPLSGEFKGLA